MVDKYFFPILVAKKSLMKDPKNKFYFVPKKVLRENENVF